MTKNNYLDFIKIFSGEAPKGLKVSKKWVIIETLIVFAVAFCIFAWTMLDLPGFKAFDGYYHIFMARQILEHGPWVDVSWLPFTVLGDSGPDQHWLFHVLITPFALIDDPYQALIWATITMGAAVPAAMNVAGRLLGIPYSPLFALLTVCAALPLPFRFLILRAQNVAIIFMVLGLVALIRQRLITLGVITFLFMQSYQAAVLMGVFTVGYIILAWLNTGKASIRPLTAVVIGGVLGLALSPWFPENINYLVFHTLFKTQQSRLSIVGSEWFTISWPSLVLKGWLAHILVVVGLLIAGISTYCDRNRRIKLDTQLFLSVTLMFLIMFHNAFRFIEYYAPFAVITTGLLLRDSGYPLHSLIHKRITAAVMSVLLIVGAWSGISELRKPPFNEPDQFYEISLYIQEHGSEGDMIFNSNWSDFVLLVPHLPKMHYVNGLDGNYLAFGDPKRFLIWYALVHGTEQLKGQDPASIIAESFGAKWAIIGNARKKLKQALLDSNFAQLRAISKNGLLFEINTPSTVTDEIKH